MTTPAKLTVVVSIAAVSFLVGRYGRNPQAASSGRRILYYHDPMHPAYKSDKPGIAPDCGMQLEPVYADGGAAEAPKPAGAIEVGAEKQQMIGVKVEPAVKGSASYTVRVPGRVVLDERRIFRVSAPVDGWVRTAGPIATGDIVRKDQVLATYYNRDFLTAQQTYLYALNTMDRFQDNESAEQLKLTKAQMRAAEENLEFLGMGEAQIREIARTRQVARNVELRAPVSGLVLVRNAFPGLRFDRGTELFRVGELEHVWVLADVFEHDARLVQAASRVAVRRQGRLIPVQMSQALPQFDPVSRALKIRLEVDNPALELRPDMFVDVEFQATLPREIHVPVDAVIDSGLRKTVFVERAKGVFEPRRVETGWAHGDRIAITKGVEEGERIVVAGTFLIDSESRLRAAVTDKDPVCGMEVNSSQTSLRYRGKTYHFCSDHCKKAFEAAPDRYR